MDGSFRRVGVRVGDADDFAVVERDRGQVGFIAQKLVFDSMMQAVDLFSNQALEFPANLNPIREGSAPVAWLCRISQEFGDGFGGDAVGVVTIGEDAPDGAAPMPAAYVDGGVQNRLVEEQFPIVGIGVVE